MKRKLIGLGILIGSLNISSCTTVKYKLFDDFESQHHLMLYCENSEGRSGKVAGLRLIEIAASTHNIDLELGRGICEEYYQHREPANGYIYMGRDL